MSATDKVVAVLVFPGVCSKNDQSSFYTVMRPTCAFANEIRITKAKLLFMITATKSQYI